MPVWAAVVLPIVTGLIGVLGGLYGTWLGVAQSREQERRRVLGETAGEFAKLIGGAANAVEYAVTAGNPSGSAVNDAENLVGESANLVAPVELLFDDATGSAARATRHELHSAIASLRAQDAAAARAAFERAEAERKSFNRHARDAVWGRRDTATAPPRWWSPQKP